MSRFGRYVLLGPELGVVVTPPDSVQCTDDTLTAQLGLSSIDVDVLANDTASGQMQIASVTAQGALPQEALSIASGKVRVGLTGLAAGAYQFVYRAALVAKPDVFDDGQVALTIAATAPTISVIRISAASLAEGDTESFSVDFAVRRSGDLSLPSSVRWAIGTGAGLIGADDLLTGQALAGTVNWDAGDGADKPFSIAIRGDTTEETNETLRIVLSNPTNGVLDVATSEVIIINDDGPPFPVISITAVFATVLEGGPVVVPLPIISITAVLSSVQEGDS